VVATRVLVCRSLFADVARTRDNRVQAMGFFETDNLKVTVRFLADFFPPALNSEFLQLVAREAWRTRCDRDGRDFFGACVGDSTHAAFNDGLVCFFFVRTHAGFAICAETADQVAIDTDAQCP